MKEERGEKVVTAELLLAMQAANARPSGGEQAAADRTQPQADEPVADPAAAHDAPKRELSAALARLGLGNSEQPDAAADLDAVTTPPRQAEQPADSRRTRDPDSAPIRVSVVQQQNLFAPVSNAHPLTQLAEQVAVALRPALERNQDAKPAENPSAPQRGDDAAAEPAGSETKDTMVPPKVQHPSPIPTQAQRGGPRGQPAPVPDVFSPNGAGAKAENLARESAPPSVSKATATQSATVQPPIPSADNASPMQQVVTRIAAELAAAEGSPAPATPPADPGAKIVYGSPVRILHIQLQPAELGTITVRMSLHDSELRIHLNADRRATADMLQSDGDTLSNALRSAGYRVDSLNVQFASADTSAGGSQSLLNGSMQQQPGGAQSGAQPSGGNSGRRQDGGTYQAQRQSDEEGSPSPRGGGLYI
ncbi:MAG TPA: flagellar hook-length control protein FliK [Hyphomicrobiaceae bacterium]|nr:flagellar hook-length control protein FliK [Hyphomicrobiaceae bacterium]